MKKNVISVVTASIIMVIAVTFIVVGVLADDTSVVLMKAINICTECIGIG